VYTRGIRGASMSLSCISSRLLMIDQIDQWQRGTDTRQLRSLIDAQEDGSIDRKLDIRTFGAMLPTG
jgi:hypothetical protein